jgi:cell wall-associated NlpC family hydrolase
MVAKYNRQGNMVGKATRMRKNLRLAELTSRLVGAPYKLGGHGVREGFDCYSLMLAVCDFWGADAPKVFRDLTVDNYPERFRQDPNGTKEILFEALASTMKEVKPSQAFAGDILITSTKGTNTFGIGIHAGGDSMLASYLERGVQLMPLRGYNILKAYRVI